MSTLVPWETARDRVLAGVRPLPPVRRPVLETLGLAAAEPVSALEPMPPFDNTAMDGFAVRAADLAGAGPDHPVRLRVTGEQPAGPARALRVGAGEAVRIMTGAPLPGDADAVVPVEWTDHWDAEAVQAKHPEGDAGGWVNVHKTPRAGQHIRLAGESATTGDEILSLGARIRAADLGLLISTGAREINVHPLPRVAVLSTGDELAPPDRPLRPGEIRDSNRPALLGRLSELGFPTLDLGTVGDDPTALAEAIGRGAAEADFLLTSGGVSVGDHDLTRRVLARVGRVEAYRVAVKPGKPQVFGHVGDTPVFGLPGNPVSSLVVFDVFVLPSLRRLAGRARIHDPVFTAELTEPVRRKAGRTEFLRVRLETDGGRWTATPTGAQGSGVLSSLTRANGYAVIAEDVDTLERGSHLACRRIARD